MGQCCARRKPLYREVDISMPTYSMIDTDCTAIEQTSKYYGSMSLKPPDSPEYSSRNELLDG